MVLFGSQHFWENKIWKIWWILTLATLGSERITLHLFYLNCVLICPKCHFLTRPSPHSKSRRNQYWWCAPFALPQKQARRPSFFYFMILISKIYCEKKNWQKSVHLFSSLTIVINRMHSISTLNSAYTN